MRKKRYTHLTKEYLQEWYSNSGKSIRKMALDVGMSRRTLSGLLKRKGIVVTRRIGDAKKDLTGQQRGRWKVLKYIGYNGRYHIWECQCDCGLIKNVIGACLSPKNPFATKKCPHICRISRHGEIPTQYFKQVKKGAIKRDLEFSVTPEFLWGLFLSQNRLCNLSHMPICFYAKHKDTKSATASLDRIDSDKGYTENNVQWIHKDINAMKWDYEEKYFKDICIKIADVERQKRQKENIEICQQT